jgi:hypothetical protein
MIRLSERNDVNRLRVWHAKNHDHQSPTQKIHTDKTLFGIRLAHIFNDNHVCIEHPLCSQLRQPPIAFIGGTFDGITSENQVCI